MIFFFRQAVCWYRTTPGVWFGLRGRQAGRHKRVGWATLSACGMSLWTGGRKVGGFPIFFPLVVADGGHGYDDAVADDAVNGAAVDDGAAVDGAAIDGAAVDDTTAALHDAVYS